MREKSQRALENSHTPDQSERAPGQGKIHACKDRSAPFQTGRQVQNSGQEQREVVMVRAKTAGRSVKRAAPRGAKGAVVAERAAVKSCPGAPWPRRPPSPEPDAGAKEPSASIAAKARRQNAKTDYNPLDMLASLSPF